MNSSRKAYLVGGGIGSLAAAAFMIRDGGMSGENITIFESLPVAGGSLDAGGNADTGYSMRGGRMLTADNYECTWDLFKTIPSLTTPGRSVFDETAAFNDRYRSHSMARLVDRRRARVKVASMGFSMHDRLELLKLAEADEAELDATVITDWLSPAFFETSFWFMWATTFAFQPWHSAVEFKRYLHRFMLEFTRIDTLAGVKRTIYNQYDSLVRPLQSWLAAQGVAVLFGHTVTALETRQQDADFSVKRMTVVHEGVSRAIDVAERDLVFVQNGSMTDSSSVGSMTEAPPIAIKGDGDGGSWQLWESLAKTRTDFGHPDVFNSCVAESSWESFTVTLKHSTFFDRMREFSGNDAGTGGLVTFKDSRWLMSIVLPHQPHFVGQPAGVEVFWGYGLFPDRVGDFVAKPMSECNGEEILRELYGHLRFDAESPASAICIPCRMPYITSMFMRRTSDDRPLPVPIGSGNLAFVSQFVEIADDVVFTVEYSVRAAQMAVYQLLHVERAVPAVTPHDKSWKTRFDAVVKAFE